jgi:hypothetical protein
MISTGRTRQDSDKWVSACETLNFSKQVPQDLAMKTY